MEALKPCPFCGAAAHLDYDPQPGFFGPTADHKPGCLLRNWDMRDYADEHSAVADWNRRADPAPALVEALKAIVADLEVAAGPRGKIDSALATARQALSQALGGE